MAVSSQTTTRISKSTTPTTTRLANSITNPISPAKRLLQHGQELRDKGRLSDALDQFVRATDLDPTLAVAHHEVADALQQRGEFEAAELSLAQACDSGFTPQLAHEHNNVGQYKLRQGEIMAALEHFRHAQIAAEKEQHLREYVDARIGMAFCAEGTGNMKEACSILKATMLGVPMELEDIASLYAERRCDSHEPL